MQQEAPVCKCLVYSIVGAASQGYITEMGSGFQVVGPGAG